MIHQLHNSEQDYLKWVCSVKVNDIGHFSVDHELRDLLKKDKPNRYPAITVYWFEDDFDRMGPLKTRLFDHIYLEEFTSGYDPTAHYKELVKIKNVERKRGDILWKLCDMLKSGVDRSSPEAVTLSKQLDRLDAKISKMRANAGVNPKECIVL